ncbi:MAG: hypothetical protein R2909_14695 [Gemmatimonadales bacterium]
MASHWVRRALVREQAASLEPPVEVEIPWPCPNESHTVAWTAGCRRAQGARRSRPVAFGDLFLQDVRAWRSS